MKTARAADREWRQIVRAWTDEIVAPHAAEFDRTERIPREVLTALAAEGCLSSFVAADHGGSARGPMEIGVMMEELSRACSSVRCIVTVHGMVCSAIARWGTAAQQRLWLPALASGETLAAFALSEPDAGSDIAAVQTRAERRPSGYAITGRKKWITAGQIADVFLTFAASDKGPVAVLVDRATSGLTITPIHGLLGLRGSMTALLTLDACPVPDDAIVGRVGFGQSAVASSALDVGRYCVAWGCVGIAQACLDASVEHAATRRQFGVAIKEHQLIRRKVANMSVDVRMARLACTDAGRLRAAADPDGVVATCVAKYVASTVCTRAARAAVQIHGAIGCSADAHVERFFRDAQAMEIIEGSTQMQQLMIADHEFRRHTVEFDGVRPGPREVRP